MAFVSYSQNFEDVMLWRALKHIDSGFYIDVGANDPSVDSVTKAFYERGWQGINVEPLALHHADLQRERPRDINLQCAAGAAHGEIDIWECDVRGWATADESVVARHSMDGHEGVFRKVPVLPLSEICSENVKGEIHFLKIDVEGLEKAVILGMDFSRFRPWVLIVEATQPNSTVESHDEWEELIRSADYLLAYRDGLNRFYVSREHAELLESLRYPPNVFDGFIRVDQLNSELRAREAESAEQHLRQQLSQTQQQLTARIAEAEWLRAEFAYAQDQVTSRGAEIERLKAHIASHQGDWEGVKSELAETQQQFSSAQARIAGLLTSTSWRVTAPLRFVSSSAQATKHALARMELRFKVWLEPHAVRLLKQPPTTRTAVQKMGRWVFAHPFLERLLESSLRDHPRLARRLKWLVLGQGAAPAHVDQLILRIEDEVARWRSGGNSCGMPGHSG